VIAIVVFALCLVSRQVKNSRAHKFGMCSQVLKLVNCGSTGVDEWLGHDGVVKSRLHHQLKGFGGPPVGSQVGETGVYSGNRVRYMHGKAYLSMDVATESEVADTEGSTATGAPL